MNSVVSQEEPVCPFFGRCAGCQYQDISYDDELRLKESSLKAVLGARLVTTEQDFRPIVPSPKIYYYRNRLDLKLTQGRDGVVHVGFSPGAKAPVIEVDACPLAIEKVSEFIPVLSQASLATLTKKYRMANLTIRCGDGDAVLWGGIGRGSLRLFERDYFYTDVVGKRVFYSLEAFFQANLSILPQIAKVIRSLNIWKKETVFFDLYGGVGLFGLIVQDLVKRVVHIEENVHAVKMAAYNSKVNQIWNMEVHEGRVEDVLSAVLGSASGMGVAMVDPPRAGLGFNMVSLLNGLTSVKHLLYLSCNPESLAEDLAGLIAGSWKIVSIQPFDFFPRTRHLETLVVLARSST